MKLDVPFIKQESDVDCGVVALQMVLQYFGKSCEKGKIAELVETEKSGATWTIGIAKAAAELGLKSEFYTASFGVDPSHQTKEFYQKFVEMDLAEKKLEEIKRKAHELGVKMEEKHLDLDSLLGKITAGRIPIVLLDWNVIRGRRGYNGHLVPIVGYDERNVYVHNQGLHNTVKFMPIEKGLFDAARTASGTDEDIVYIGAK